jgi:large conductance mechanosensitive channel
MIKEFKAFIIRGNVFDLAVGVIIGGAMGRLVSSLVNDIIMPFLGLILGRVDVKEIKLILVEGSEATPEVAILVGSFLQHVIDFILIGFVIFLIIKFMNSFKKKQEEVKVTPSQPSEEVLLLREIAASLKK